MRILTVVKQVPDSRAPIKVTADGLGIETDGLKYVCDPFDEFAVEQAVRLKETRSDVEEVQVITVGPQEAVQTLRTALAVGADVGIHICDGEIPVHDELLLAEVLAAAIRRDQAGFELILCGKQNIDTDAGELGPALAELLKLPHVGAVTSLELADDGATAKVHRRIEGAEEVVQVELPALLTCEKGLVEPRYPALPNLMKAKKKPVEVLSLSDLPGIAATDGRLSFVKLQPPLPKPPCEIIEGEPEEMARELVRKLREEARVI